MKRMESTPGPDYTVGYGKPPKANQFRKGQSGNRKGRKRGEENMIAVFKRLATRQVKVTIDGVTMTMPMARVVIMNNMKSALNQNQIAMGNILRLAEYAGEFRDWTDPEVTGKPLFMPEKMTTDEFLAYYGVDTIHVTAPKPD